LKYFEKALHNKIIQRGEGHQDLVTHYTSISEVYYKMENTEKGDVCNAKADEINKE